LTTELHGQVCCGSISLENREKLLDALYAELEQNMELIGATAINDKLQDGVPHTIAQLLDAGIRFWVLTGDKQGVLRQTANVMYDFALCILQIYSDMATPMTAVWCIVIMLLF